MKLLKKKPVPPEDGSDPEVEGTGVDDERDGGMDRVDKSLQSNTKLDSRRNG